LRSQGFDTVVATSGERFETLRTEKFSMMISDRMPGMSGWSLRRAPNSSCQSCS
jgi:DNA-binding response OmpR family regulator